MNVKLDDAIDTLCKKITKDVTADDALKYTQAALNLANVKKAVDK